MRPTRLYRLCILGLLALVRNLCRQGRLGVLCRRRACFKCSLFTPFPSPTGLAQMFLNPSCAVTLEGKSHCLLRMESCGKSNVTARQDQVVEKFLAFAQQHGECMLAIKQARMRSTSVAFCGQPRVCQSARSATEANRPK